MAASAPAEATDDGELLRLLDTYGQAEYEMGAANHLGRPGAFRRGQDALAAIKAHIDQHYVRRDDPHYRILDRASEVLTGYR